MRPTSRDATRSTCRRFRTQVGKWQISVDGGLQPRWRRDGQELFFVAPDNRLMAAPIRVAPGGKALEAGAPVPLFQSKLATGPNIVRRRISGSSAVRCRGRRPLSYECFR